MEQKCLSKKSIDCNWSGFVSEINQTNEMKDQVEKI